MPLTPTDMACIPPRRRSTWLRTGGLLAAAVASAAWPIRAQQEASTFRAETTLIRVTAVVTDDGDALVRGLTREDFTLLEDGRPQPLVGVDFVDLLVGPRLEVGDEPVDVQSNAGAAAGRAYLLVLDDLNVPTLDSGLVQRAAATFIERHLRAGDSAAVIFSSGRADVDSGFTQSRARLLSTIEQYIGGRPPQANPRRSLGPDGPFILPPATTFANLRTNAFWMLDGLKGLVEWTGQHLAGRAPTVLLFSEGVQGYTRQALLDICRRSDRNLTMDRICALAGAAARANVALFTVDPRGGAAAFVGDVSTGPLERAAGANSERLGTVIRDVVTGEGSLKGLADETGGLAIVGTNDLDAAYERVVRDVSAHYVLSFAPSAASRRDAFHRIEVRVNRPGLRVRARKGYSLADSTPEAPAARPDTLSLRALLGAPLPVAGLPLSAFAAPFKGRDGRATVLVGVDIEAPTVEATGPGGSAQVVLEVAFGTVDGSQLDGATQTTIRAAVPADEQPVLRSTGIRLLRQIRLPPGTRQVRVAAREPATGRTGMIYLDVEVPDFDAPGDARLSGLLVASPEGGWLTSAEENEPGVPTLETPPAAARRFKAGGDIIVGGALYVASGVRGDDLMLRTSLMDGGRRLLLADEQPGQDAFSTKVPLGNLAPGRYVVRVEVRRGAVTLDSRSTRFTIEE